MKKILNYLLVFALLAVVMFAFTGCSKEPTATVETQNQDTEEVVENTETTDEQPAENVSFQGIYVVEDSSESLEGVAVIEQEEDKIVLVRDNNGTGIDRVSKDEVHGNYLESEFINETFTLKKLEDNITFNHPMFTFEELELVPATGKFTGIYENENFRLIVFTNYDEDISVLCADLNFDNAIGITIDEFTLDGDKLIGTEDAYQEKVEMSLNGDTLTFKIDSEDSKWQTVNRDFTLVK